MPASRRRRIVLRPCGRSSRCAAGVSGAATPRSTPLRDDLYASAMLPQTIAEAARRFGDRTAYVAPDGRPLSYAEIDRISDEAAVGMAVRGARAGGVVGLPLPPGVEYLRAYCAAAKIGAITAGVNDRLASREREAVLAVAEPELTLNEAHELDDLRVADSAPPALAPDPERPVAIIFTSGTTGLPKG